MNTTNSYCNNQRSNLISGLNEESRSMAYISFSLRALPPIAVTIRYLTTSSESHGDSERGTRPEITECSRDYKTNDQN